MTDKSAAAIRELAYKHAEPKVIWNDGNMSIYPDEEKIESLLSDLTALISEHYVSKEDAGYPLEFIEWLIKDQEIFFGELNDEYILNDNIHVDGRKLQTIDELFNYWEENVRC